MILSPDALLLHPDGRYEWSPDRAYRAWMASMRTLAEVLPGTVLVDSARATAAAVLEALGPGDGAGTVEYRVTDNVERFREVGSRFLGYAPDPVTWVDIGPASPPFIEP